MKGLILLAVLGAFFISITGCGKNNYPGASSSSLRGSWELRQVQAGMIPTVQHPPGNGSIAKFTAGNYEFYANGQLTKSGTYTITRDTTAGKATCLTIPAGRFTNRIIYDGDQNATKVFVQISGDTLTFLSGCYALDAGHSEKYVRR